MEREIPNVLPMISTKRIPLSDNPKTKTASGTQQTLGNVCNPRKTGPRNSFSDLNRHIDAPSPAPSRMLSVKPTTNLDPLTRFAPTNRL